MPEASLRDESGRALELRHGRKIVFVPHKEEDFGGLEKHLLDLLERLQEPGLELSIICFGKDVYTERIDPARFRNITVKQRPEPITLTDWIRLFRELRADVVVFCYGWIGSFSWPAALGALLAGVRKRFAIQHLVPPRCHPRSKVPRPGPGCDAASENERDGFLAGESQRTSITEPSASVMRSAIL